MRDLTYYVAVSLDGFIAATDGTFDAFPVEGDHMDVVMTEFADALPTHVLQAIGATAPRTRFDTVIQGWNSYGLARAVGIERPYAHLREFVATRRGAQEPAGVTFTPDAVKTVRELKREEGLGIYLCGGGQLAGSLLPEIDRLVVKRNPIVMGDGVPMFGRAVVDPVSFRSVEVRTFNSGVVISEYVRG